MTTPRVPDDDDSNDDSNDDNKDGSDDDASELNASGKEDVS